MPIAVGRPVNGRLVFWLCVAFVLGVVASLVVYVRLRDWFFVGTTILVFVVLLMAWVLKTNS